MIKTKIFRTLATGWIFEGEYLFIGPLTFVRPIGCPHYGYGAHQVEELQIT